MIAFKLIWIIRIITLYLVIMGYLSEICGPWSPKSLGETAAKNKGPWTAVLGLGSWRNGLRYCRNILLGSPGPDLATPDLGQIRHSDWPRQVTWVVINFVYKLADVNNLNRNFFRAKISNKYQCAQCVSNACKSSIYQSSSGDKNILL